MKNIIDIYEGIFDADNKNNVGKANVEVSIKAFLEEHYKIDHMKKITIEEQNKDGKWVVDIIGNVYPINNHDIKRLTNDEFVFGKVRGHFSIIDRSLNSLEGCPTEVTEDFVISGCRNIKSLEGCPQVVKGNVSVSGTSIKDFTGITQKIGGDLYANDCIFLSSFSGLPKTIKGYFTITNCPELTRIWCFPKVKGSVACDVRLEEFDIELSTRVDGEVYYY